MFKRIDTYIIKKFLGTYVFSLFLIIAIAVMLDVNENLDDFIRSNAPLNEIVFDHYLNFIPWFTTLFSPLFVFISVIFFTSKLADNSEIIAMQSSGMSIKRLLIPYLFSALVISTFNLYLNSYVIPKANVKRIEFEDKYIRKKKKDFASNIQLKVSPNVIAYVERYDDQTKIGYHFSLERFENKVLMSRLTAQSIQYDSLNKWKINNYLIRKFEGKQEKLIAGATMDTIIEMRPLDFLITVSDAEQMTSPELSDYIQRQITRGAGGVSGLKIELEKRFSMFMAAFILTVIGMSISSKKVKGGMGLNIGIGLALGSSYILFMTISSTFAVNGQTSARLAAWIPNIIFTFIALILYMRAPK
ncbi:MAG: LptF/LptG family permease [Bacteroidales bacterium]